MELSSSGGFKRNQRPAVEELMRMAFSSSNVSKGGVRTFLRIVFISLTPASLLPS